MGWSWEPPRPPPPVLGTHPCPTRWGSAAGHRAVRLLCGCSSLSRSACPSSDRQHTLLAFLTAFPALGLDHVACVQTESRQTPRQRWVCVPCSELPPSCNQLKPLWCPAVSSVCPLSADSARPSRAVGGLFSDLDWGLQFTWGLRAQGLMCRVRVEGQPGGRGPLPGDGCGFHPDFWEQRSTV